MNDFGGGQCSPGQRRSRLADYADMAGPPRTADTTGRPHAAGRSRTAPPAPPAAPGPITETRSPTDPAEAGSREVSEEETAARLAEFAASLEMFRGTAVLVPLRDDGWLTADTGGVRWILAFSDESALARYALARGEDGDEWPYETVLGARLLDAGVPEVGVPCGVALDAADGPEYAVLFPPVAGIVPDAFAVDRGFTGRADAADEEGAQR